jgi:amphi-Trp domain-containing protein
MPKQSLEFTSTIPVAALAAYLESLARCMREGHVSLEVGNQYVDMELAPDVSVELEASSSGSGKSIIEIKASWRTPQHSESAPALIIHGTSVPSMEMSDGFSTSIDS